MLSNSSSEFPVLLQPAETTKLRAPFGDLFGLQEAPWEPIPNQTLLIGAPKDI